MTHLDVISWLSMGIVGVVWRSISRKSTEVYFFGSQCVSLTRKVLGLVRLSGCG